MCPMDNECEQICGLNITDGSGTGNDSSFVTCSCLNGFTLDDDSANCSGSAIEEGSKIIVL